MGMSTIVAGLLLLGGLASAAAAENPYSGIFVRNVFALKPPPPPPSLEDNRPPPPKILLRGLATVLGRKQVLFDVETPPKPPQPGGKTAMILRLGERENEIEVVEIDETTGTVTFNNHGVTEVKTLEKDSARPTGAAPVVGVPPVPGGPTMIAPRPTLPTPGLQTIPTRTPKPAGTELPVPAPPGAP